MKINRPRILGIALLLSLQCLAFSATYYVAPTAQGDGSGSSAVNAADYINSTFWSNVHTTLSSQTVTVYFVSGSYNRGVLNFQNKGNATYKLTMQGQTDTEAVLNSVSSYLLDLRGSRNILVKDLNLSGSGCTSYGVILREDTNACRDIELNSCTFTDLTSTYYGAISVGGFTTQNIVIKSCTFNKVGSSRLAHGIYAANGPHLITVDGNTFTDIAGSHVKLRNLVNDVTITNNTFNSTATYQPEIDGASHARGLIFIAIENYNSAVPDNEMFGTNYDIHGNSFSFPNLGTVRDAVKWYHSGYETGGFDQILNAADAATLETGAPFYKRGVLNDTGAITTLIQIYSNTYNSYVKRRAVYEWQYAGNSGNKDIYNAVGYMDLWTYDYETDSGNPDGWSVTESPPNSDVYVTTNPSGGHGSKGVRLIDSSSSYNCNMNKVIGTAIPRGYYRTYLYVSSNSSDLYPVYTNTASTTIYWLKAKSNGTWGNNDASFSGSWSTGNWYIIEMEFNFATDKYTVWVNNTRIAAAVTIPTTNTAMSDTLYIAPATTSATGSMIIDYNKLATYEP